MGTRGKGRTVEAPPEEGISAAPARGRADRRRTAQRAARRRRRSLVRELPLVVVVALVIALVLKTFFIQVFVIPSGSMEQTIQIGDRVLVDKFTPWFGNEPGRGEVVVFQDPGGWLENERKVSTDGLVLRKVKQAFSFVGLLPSDNEHDLIKRVIGVAGDTVECCDSKGRLSVNGIAVDETYLAPGNAPSRQPFKVTVPAGRLWVMGDHRDLSADSRFHMGNPGGGTIPVADVVGRAFLIAWPLPRMNRLDVPAALSSIQAGQTPASVPTSVPTSVPASAGTREGGAEGEAVAGAPGPAGRSIAESAQQVPIPAEPSLVMGVLGFFPFIRRKTAGLSRRRLPGRRPGRSPG